MLCSGAVSLPGITSTATVRCGAAQILGMCERSFRRHLSRFEADGLEGLIDRRLESASNRRAPVDEVMALTEQYRSRYTGWNVKHFHRWYRRENSTVPIAAAVNVARCRA